MKYVYIIKRHQENNCLSIIYKERSKYKPTSLNYIKWTVIINDIKREIERGKNVGNN